MGAEIGKEKGSSSDHAKEGNDTVSPVDIKIPSLLMGQQRERAPQNDPPGQADGNGDSEGARRSFNVSRGLWGDRYDVPPTREHQKMLGINGLMRAFSRKPQFSGGWDEDFDHTIRVFETLSEMCQLTWGSEAQVPEAVDERDKRKTIEKGAPAG